MKNFKKLSKNELRTITGNGLIENVGGVVGGLGSIIGGTVSGVGGIVGTTVSNTGAIVGGIIGGIAL
ncbi:hypothetical protein [Chryseobacterium sp. ISL-6]|uniref:bacteriocin-like protein n=1 Tax=Chryseobacterium sp. ISL-6 TaxID=2819143 RepID=UPI001BE6B87D|nr:hypothetical protein [Chryseobacterium sp. ISL-6]MBT2620299.1 hypothetical protein [Chryseobacterium sp. ISL-6]